MKAVDELTDVLESRLKFGGLWLKYTNNLMVKIQLFRFLIIVLIWCLPILKLVETGPRLLLSPTGALVFIGLDVIFLVGWSLVNCQRIRETIQILKWTLSNHKTPWEEEIIGTFTGQFRYIMSVTERAFVYSATGYVLLPILIDIALSVMEKPPYRFPGILDSYISMSTSRDLRYMLLLATAKLWIILIVPAYLAFVRLIFYFAGVCIAEFRILKMRLERLGRDSGELSDEWDLSQAIANHQEVIKLMISLKWIWFPALVQFFICTIAMTLVLKVINTALADNDMLLFFIVVALLAIFLIVLFAFSCTGQLLQEEADMVLATIYNMPWYQQHPRVRKSINMMMRQAAFFKTNVYKSLRVNFATFGVMVQNMYSLYMLLNSADR